MNETVYAAIVARLKQSAEREAILPERARVTALVVKVMTDPMPATDGERREKVENVVHDLAILGDQLNLLVQLGITDTAGEVAAMNATVLMFGLELALHVVDASLPVPEPMPVDGGLFGNG